MIKRIKKVLFWAIAALLVAMIVYSLDYSFFKALILSGVIVAGAFLLSVLARCATSKAKERITKNTIFIAAAVVVSVIACLFFVDSIFEPREVLGPRILERTPRILVNPVFVLFVMSLLVIVDRVLDNSKREDDQNKEQRKTVKVLSRRKAIEVPIDRITYIESLDDIVFLHLSDGRKIENKTPISKWQAILDSRFIRIHRAFLVNGDYVTSKTKETIIVSGEELPISRKNREG
ncbi:MAG: LytTR family transcriptional regulator [Bacteroidales bacterium]|nr:LytTR family transcriptional regulator [Bacteroidales bacterium]